VLAEPTEVGLKKKAQAVIVATGSEVQLGAARRRSCWRTAPDRRARGVHAQHHQPSTARMRPTKAPCCPQRLPRVAVEMGVTDGWWKYGCAAVVGIDTYGESAPAPVLFKHFGFTPDNVADTVQARNDRSSKRNSISASHQDFMAIKIGINGFGRIGRNGVARCACRTSQTSKSWASTTCSNPITWPTCSSTTACTAASRARSRVDGGTLVVNGKRIRLTAGT
jgi:hypothetical protein